MIIEPENYDNGFFKLSFPDGRFFYAAFWLDGQTQLVKEQMTEVDNPIRSVKGKLEVNEQVRHALGGDQLEEFYQALEDKGLTLPPRDSIVK